MGGGLQRMRSLAQRGTCHREAPANTRMKLTVALAPTPRDTVEGHSRRHIGAR